MGAFECAAADVPVSSPIVVPPLVPLATPRMYGRGGNEWMPVTLVREEPIGGHGRQKGHGAHPQKIQEAGEEDRLFPKYWQNQKKSG